MLIAHTFEYPGEDDLAYAHALALAVRGGARLVSVHVRMPSDRSSGFPDSRDLLARWDASGRPLAHDRIEHPGAEDVADGLLETLRKLWPSLLVAVTRARGGVTRLFAGSDSVVEAVGRNLGVPMLLLPLGCPGFVDPGTGAIALSRMLLPVGSERDAQLAVDAAAMLARLAGVDACELVLLHVADGSAAPSPQVPAGMSLVRRAARGRLTSAILACAREVQPDVLVMVTRGHDSLGDVLLASHTERVLHEAHRPLLWVPA
jgi:nucleotide-binding universal stress UspA family protein